MSGGAKTPDKEKILVEGYLERVDPAVAWAIGVFGTHGLASAGPGDDYFFLSNRRNKYWLPVLIGLGEITVKDFADGVQFTTNPAKDKADWKKYTAFSTLETGGLSAMRKNFYCAPLVTAKFFDVLRNNQDLQNFVRNVTLGLPLDQESLPPSAPIPPPPV